MLKVGVFHLRYQSVHWQDAEVLAASEQHESRMNSFIEKWARQGYDLDRVLQTQSSEPNVSCTTVTVWMRKPRLEHT